MKDPLFNPKPQFEKNPKLPSKTVGELATKEVVAEMILLIKENKKIEMEEEKKRRESIWR